MKLKSTSLVKLVILLSIAIGLTSGWYAQKTRAGLAAQRQAITKLEQDTRELKRSNEVLGSVLKSEQVAQPLEITFTALLVKIMEARLENGIAISAVNPNKQGGAAGASQVSQLAEKLDPMDKSGNASAMSLRVNIRGTYSSYLGFLQYVKTLRELPVSIVYLKIEAKQFEIGLRAYGT